MNLNCRISDSEWQVMKVLWQESPLTAALIIKNLKPNTSWNPKTIQTLIARLVKKGALGVNKESSLNQYYPLVFHEDCMREETNSFLQRVYGGSLQLLLSNFVKNENLSKQEIEELKKLLDEKMK